MKQLLRISGIIYFLCIIQSQAQSFNQVIGLDITPTENNGDGTPAPYDGSDFFSPGSQISIGDWNLLLGVGAGGSITSSRYNVLIGGLAGAQITTGSDNTFIGMFTGDQTSTGTFDNVYLGNFVARYNTGSDNVIIGTEAGLNLTGGSDNTIIGEEAGEELTIGDRNVFVGEDAGQNTTTGSDNVFVGREAGFNNTTARSNTFIGGASSSSIHFTLQNIDDSYNITSQGNASGRFNETGIGNTFVGAGSGQDNEDGNANTFLGYDAGANTTNSNGNTFVGYGAGFDNNRVQGVDNSNRNTYLGATAGGTNRYGSDNVGIGWNADFVDDGGLNQTRNNRNVFMGSSVSIDGTEKVVIGHDAQATGNNTGAIVIGAFSTVNQPYAAALGHNVNVTTGNTMALGGDTTTNRFSVGIGTVAANQNASLELADTDKGFLVNRVTTVQRTAMEMAAASGNALTTTDAGLMVYDTDAATLFVWTGTTWVSATSLNTDAQKIDTFQLVDNKIELSLEADGEAVKELDLSAYLDNTDTQSLSLATNTLSISGNASTVDLSSYLDNTDAQTLDFSGTSLSIDNGNSVDLSSLQDGTGTDNQDLDLSGNNLSLTNDATSVDLSSYLDNTDAQTLGFSGTSLSIANGNSVDLSSLQDGTGTDNQDLDLSGNNLSLTNDATSVDLSGYLDNTDAQTLGFLGTSLSIANGNSVDLSSLQDGTGTDNQDLDLSGNSLSLTNDATSVDLSGYLDNTDSQTLGLSGATLSIANGNNVDLSSLQDGTGTDNQDLNLSGNNLSLTNDATVVDLSGYLDNTDAQNLDLTNNTLSISNGNAVDFSAFVNTDGQDLTSASLSGTDLTIEIENGASVSVDLSPLLADLENRLSNLEQTLGVNTPEGGRSKQQAILYQNIPNPFDSTSSIKYYIPSAISRASIVFSNMSGQVISNIEITDREEGELHINSDGLASGTYFYTLYTENQKVDTKKMVIN